MTQIDFPPPDFVDKSWNLIFLCCLMYCSISRNVHGWKIISLPATSGTWWETARMHGLHQRGIDQNRREIDIWLLYEECDLDRNVTWHTFMEWSCDKGTSCYVIGPHRRHSVRVVLITATGLLFYFCLSGREASFSLCVMFITQFPFWLMPGSTLSSSSPSGFYCSFKWR